MGNNDDLGIILGLLGLGYLLYKYRGIQDTVKTEVLDPITRLRTGTSVHYSPYSQRYFMSRYRIFGEGETPSFTQSGEE